MDSALKQRLIGAAVLVALAMIFLPMLLQGPDVGEPDAAQVPLSMPAAPDQEFETRELPLAVPQPAGEGSVLGGPSAPAADPNAVATVDIDGDAAPRVDAPAEEPVDPSEPLQAVDAASGEALAAAPAAQPVPEPEPEPAASPAPAAPAAPLPASSAGGRYAVNVGSFSNLANARALADKLRAAGLPVTSESVDVNGKPAMRVRVGPYAERTVAEAARLRAEGVSGTRTVVVTLDAASPPAPAAASRPATAATVGFAVQLGAFSTEADANALRDKARAAGFVAFHQRIATDNGLVWRVRVGPEADRAAAERLRDSIADKLGLRETIIVSHP
ncbi:SPOR domain-containing protein [uncultured Arenimonas sp.]|uniref:SPOR domain-containing protein n=1 Tax=uncultured Arenimonas sp. TaxID=546226 RepID=UPI0030DB410E